MVIATRTLLLIVFSSFLWTEALWATAQRADRLLINGEVYPLHSNPLEPYFALYPDKKGKHWAGSTGLWRRYIAEFEFKDDYLIVSDIQVRYRDEELKIIEGKAHIEWHSVVDEVMPSAKDRNVRWFTGMLIVPKGKLERYVHMGYASEYESYELYWVEKGKLIASKNFNGSEYIEYKRKQFEAYKLTAEFSSRVEKIKASNDDKDNSLDIEGFIFEFDSYSETIYIPFESR